MEKEKKLTYFFDDVTQILKVTDELVEKYAETIINVKFLQAQVKEALFKPIKPERAMENFVKAIKGEEEIDEGPVKSTKQIIEIYLNEKAPVKEIDTYLWMCGGFANDYDDEWFEINAKENLNLVLDKASIDRMLRQFMINRIS